MCIRDSPLEQSLGDLEVSLDPRKVQEVLDELEFASLHYQTEEQKKEQAGKWNLIRDFGEADRIFRQAGKQESLGLHLIAEKGRVLAAALCWKAREAYTCLLYTSNQESMLFPIRYRRCLPPPDLCR